METTAVGQSLSHIAANDGWYYFGAGSVAGTTANEPDAVYSGSYDYNTLITISPPGADVIYIGGTAGDDDLVGTAGDDVIVAGEGDDELTGATDFSITIDGFAGLDASDIQQMMVDGNLVVGDDS